MHDVSNPEVIQTLLEIADAARPVLYWRLQKAEGWLPGLQEKLRKLDELESIEPPTQTGQGETRMVLPDDLVMKVSEKVEDRPTKKILEEDPPPSVPPEGGSSTT